MNRKIESLINNDLQEKMVFIGGPRQCGKTTIAKSLIEPLKGALYLNWDNPEDRKKIKNLSWDEGAPLVVFDELHKFPKWKIWIKGLWDVRHPRQIIT